jgi:hypothetical protein
MVYHGYENKIEVMLLEGDVWHEVTSLYRTVNAVRRTNLNTVAGRTQVLEMFMGADAHFNVESRFPEGIFINEGAGEWSLLFTQLRWALQHKPSNDSV